VNGKQTRKLTLIATSLSSITTWILKESLTNEGVGSQSRVEICQRIILD